MRPAAGFPILASNHGRAPASSARGMASRSARRPGRGVAAPRRSGPSRGRRVGATVGGGPESRRRARDPRARRVAARGAPRRGRGARRSPPQGGDARARALPRNNPSCRDGPGSARDATRTARVVSRRNPRWIAGGAREAPRGARRRLRGRAHIFAPRKSRGGAKPRLARSRARSRAPVRPVPGAITPRRVARREANALTKRSRARGGRFETHQGVHVDRGVSRRARARIASGGEGMRSRLALPRSGCSSEERRGDARATSARGR